MDDLRTTVAATLRFLAGGWVFGSDNQSWLVEVADEIERSGPEDWMTCPLCAEVVCDSGCPLEPLTAQRTTASPAAG